MWFHGISLKDVESWKSKIFWFYEYLIWLVWLQASVMNFLWQLIILPFSLSYSSIRYISKMFLYFRNSLHYSLGSVFYNLFFPEQSFISLLKKSLNELFLFVVGGAGGSGSFLLIKSEARMEISQHNMSTTGYKIIARGRSKYVSGPHSNNIRKWRKHPGPIPTPFGYDDTYVPRLRSDAETRSRPLPHSQGRLSLFAPTHH